MKKTFALFFLLYLNTSFAQFAPAAGMPGSTAIYKDSSIFKSWATTCVIERGWQNIADTTLGRASVGDNTSAIAKAGENGVVSLGDGGTATLSFSSSIYNGPGYDFAVFENTFLDTFLELAFVEVSTDGNRFVRFASTSNTQDTIQVAGFGYLQPTAINNLAGKYRVNFGTPFDLEEIKDSAGVDINNIQFVRIIDVVGSIVDSFAQKDASNHKINDPWPTPFASSGFDLDAVGVIHTHSNAVSEIESEGIQVFPTLVSDKIFIQHLSPNEKSIAIEDMLGQKKYYSESTEESTAIDVKNLDEGLYFLVIKDKSRLVAKRFYKTD